MFRISSVLPALIAGLWLAFPVAAKSAPVHPHEANSVNCLDMTGLKVAENDAVDSTNGDDNWHNVSLAGSATFQTPTHGCIVVTFSARVSPDSGDAPMIGILLDGEADNNCFPFYGQFAVDSNGAPFVYQTMTFHCYSLVGGTHTVQMQFENSQDGRGNNDLLLDRSIEVRYRQ